MKFLSCIKQTANASPNAKVSVVDTVGAAPKGQASRTISRLIKTSAILASELFGLFAIAMIFTPNLFKCGKILISSSLSPLYEIASTKSFLLIIPRSPCSASVGCTKKLGVPVLAIVAAILAPMCPLLPTPVTTNFPLHSSINLTAFSISLPIKSICLISSSASSFKTSFAFFKISFILSPFYVFL